MRHFLAKSINFLFSAYKKNSNKKDILIYADRGVLFYPALGLFNRVRGLVDLDSYHVKLVTAKDINNSSWGANTQLFIMPGGRSKPFYASLQDNGNSNLISYVKAGGNYLGICAGAYYGCAVTEFEKGQPLEVILTGPLNFFPGKAIGPAYALGEFRYHSEVGARIANINWRDSKVGVYFNGGCYFENANSYPNVNVLATYTDIDKQPPAIISCKVGKGQAVLSGVHVETNQQIMKFNPFKRQDIYRGLLQFDSQQTNILKAILQQCQVRLTAK